MIMVDEMRVWPHATGIFRRGSCHLTTTGVVSNLHEFALLIGLRRSWFQNGRVPHYDLTRERRDTALINGAVFVPAKEQARHRRSLKTPGGTT